MNFSEKLLLIRKNKGYSQEELAEELDVSRQAIVKWESGQSYPEIHNLIELSKLFNVTVDYLVKDNEGCIKKPIDFNSYNEKLLGSFLIKAKNNTYAGKGMEASVYPHYVAKAEKKGRTKAEVDEIIRWLTGYSQEELEEEIDNQTDFETFFHKAPDMNSSRSLIKGVVCGVRVEDIEEPTMREIRYLDKLIDELAKGKAMEKILRT